MPIPLKLPPLRERPEEISEFIQLFIRKYSDKLNKIIKGISPQTVACLQAYSWPGNVRELENIIERMVALAETDWITEDDLPIELRYTDHETKSAQVNYNEILKKATSAFEKRLILSALNQHGWIQAKTADVLGIHRKTLEYKIKKLKLQDVIDKKKNQKDDLLLT